jgi:hypothetical protein
VTHLSLVDPLSHSPPAAGGVKGRSKCVKRSLTHFSCLATAREATGRRKADQFAQCSSAEKSSLGGFSHSPFSLFSSQ